MFNEGNANPSRIACTSYRANEDSEFEDGFSGDFSSRRVFHRGEAFYFLMVLFHTVVILAKGKPCSMKGMQNQAEYDACMSYRANEDSKFEDGLVCHQGM